MKKVFLVVFLAMASIATIAQQQVDSIRIKSKLKLGAKTVTAISSDTTDASLSDDKLITEAAAKKYARSFGGGGGGSIINIGNSNLRLTGNRSLSGADLYTIKFDSTRGFKIASVLGDLLYIDQYGLLTLQSSNASEDDIPTRVTLSAQEDTATFTFTESTKIKAEKINPNNGSAYKILVRNESSKLVEYVDAVTIDTNDVATRGYVNYKDDQQQTFIDFRKLDVDSSLWTGYTSRARTQQIVDSIKAKDLIRDDTLTAHNAAILANQNAINTLDALTVKLAGSQTITGDKVSTGLTTARANSLGASLNANKGLRLENLTATTSGTPLENSPSLYLRGNVWNTGASSGGIQAGDNPIEWSMNTSGLSGNTVNNMDAYLDLNMRWGSNSPVRIARFTKAGLETNLFQNNLTLGQPGNSGILTLNRSSGGATGFIIGDPAGIRITAAQIFLTTAGYIQLSSSVSFGSRFSMSTGLLIQPDANAAANSASRLSVIGNASIGANVAAPTNGFQVAGRTRLTGLEAEISTKTADYTVTETDHTILVDATSGNVTITLRTAVGSKQLYNIKRIDNSGNTVTVATTSSQNIDGSTTYTGLSSQYKYVQVQANGAAYFIISNN